MSDGDNVTRAQTPLKYSMQFPMAKSKFKLKKQKKKVRN